MRSIDMSYIVWRHFWPMPRRRCCACISGNLSCWRCCFLAQASAFLSAYHALPKHFSAWKRLCRRNKAGRVPAITWILVCPQRPVLCGLYLYWPSSMDHRIGNKRVDTMVPGISAGPNIEGGAGEGRFPVCFA